MSNNDSCSAVVVSKDTVGKTAELAGPRLGIFAFVFDGALVVRAVVRSPEEPTIGKKNPQGINPKDLLLDLIQRPILGPEQLWLVEYRTQDLNYESVTFPDENVKTSVVRV